MPAGAAAAMAPASWGCSGCWGVQCDAVPHFTPQRHCPACPQPPTAPRITSSPSSSCFPPPPALTMTQRGSRQTSPRPDASAPAASTPSQCRRTVPWPAFPSTAGCLSAGCSAKCQARWGTSPPGRSVTRSTRQSWRPLLWAAPASSEVAKLTPAATHGHLTSLLLLSELAWRSGRGSPG